MGRLYTFGCSFTHYVWPTWADFVGTQFDHYENWGMAGAGNFYITSKVVECNQMNKLTKDDTVLIMLSSFTRHDYISRASDFVVCGNIYSQTYYDDNFIEKYWSEEYGFYMTWFGVNAVKNLLDNIGCNYKIMCGFDLYRKETHRELYEDLTKPRVIKCMKYFETALPGDNLKDYTEKKILNSKYYKFDDGEDDPHPTISIHHDWVKDMLPEYYTPSMDELKVKWEGMMDTNKRKLQMIYDGILFEPNKAKNFTNRIIR